MFISITSARRCVITTHIDSRLAKISEIVHQLQNPKITFTVTFPQLVALADIFLESPTLTQVHSCFHSPLPATTRAHPNLVAGTKAY